MKSSNNISFFEGAFFKGQPCGMGTLFYKNGKKSEGMFSDRDHCKQSLNLNDEVEIHMWTFESDHHYFGKGKIVISTDIT